MLNRDAPSRGGSFPSQQRTHSNFTDYRSQGQTIATLMVDLAKPPPGRIDLFNIYVALSRSSGRDTIRLLWDFDDSMLLASHDPELAAEDDQVRKMDEET
jgi:hypothetical protein